VFKGDKIGIIGRNGAGKTTLLKILSRLVYPTEGEVVISGRDTSLLGLGIGFNQSLTGRENIYLNASLHGLERCEIDEKLEDILAFSEIEKFVDTPVKFYSNGMYMRLAFAVAAHLDPDILLLDEVLTVGDMAFQQKCLHKVEDMTGRGRTILFVSHSMGHITRFCDRCLWLEEGYVVADGTAADVTNAYAENQLKVSSSLSFSKNDPAEKNGKTEQSRSVHDDGFSNSAVCAELVSARVMNQKSETISTAAINEPVGIEFVYDVFEKYKLLVPGIGLFDSQNFAIFWAADNDLEHINKIKKRGQHKSIVWLPENFLNEGLYYVTLTLVTPTTSPMQRHFAVEKALSFYACEAQSIVDTARGFMPRDFPGVLRPKLKWELESTSSDDHRE
jgi:lipopolysaccharide transport system ATP-binding protein